MYKCVECGNEMVKSYDKRKISSINCQRCGFRMESFEIVSLLFDFIQLMSLLVFFSNSGNDRRLQSR